MRRFPPRTAQLERLLSLDAAGRLGQSYLFVGPDGSGKEATALELARLLNCRDPQRCREAAACESCQKTLTFQHPDVRWLCPAPASLTESQAATLLAAKAEDPFWRPEYARSAEVLVGQPDSPGPLTVRSLLHFLQLRPYQGRRKVAVVDQAQRLRAGAANALLKMLEEPPADALLILLASSREAVLPTILSRCAQVRFAPYPEAELAAALAEVYGLAPAAARDLAHRGDGDVRRAAELRHPEAQAVAAWGERLLADLARGDLAAGLVAAEQLHKGRLPDDVAEAAGVPSGRRQVRDLLPRRRRALMLCETLQRGYRERLHRALAAGGEDAAGAAGPLVRAIARVEAARADLQGNVNIGLAMAVLFQELIAYAGEERTARPLS